MSKSRIFRITGITLVSVMLAAGVYGVVTLEEQNDNYEDANNHLAEINRDLGTDLLNEQEINKALNGEIINLSDELVNLKDSLQKLDGKVETLEQDKKSLEQAKKDLEQAKKDLIISKEKILEEYRQLKATKAKEGASTPTSVSRGNQSQSIGKTMYMSATAYTAYCTGCSGTTRTGIDLRANPGLKVIAVDPRVIPLGTKVHVEGYGYAIAGDTGGAIKGSKIDIFIPDRQNALKWGRKTVKVTILK